MHADTTFLWGAATAGHQIEGNNTTSDIWALEHRPDSPLPERSGDACDSYHRWPEDLDLLAELGLNSYRFSLEWARIEPEPGHISHAQLAHYRAVIEGCLRRGIVPVVTLHHFTSPAWFSAAGGWTAPDAIQRFRRYVQQVRPILDGVPWVCTINEPNILAMVARLRSGDDPPESERGEPQLVAGALPPPDPDVSAALFAAHQEARAELSDLAGLRSGWTVANQNFQALPGAEALRPEWSYPREDQFLDVAIDDDFVGVQAYTRVLLAPSGPVDPGADVRRTQTGWEFYPHALAGAVRHTAERTGGVPILVTENGIATDSDEDRIEYTDAALRGLRDVIDEGVDVRGYLHWSLLDNYEWGSWGPRFGLVAVDRTTFARTIKPSGRWFGERAQVGLAPA
ncbi:family 1 glycosylhydrolase [Lipingzhangella sp. LS1_29]|uniref:Family 1 glycosylhydrolase n=1 Tax=Lipingzhangella rawalii TaxID=2055835 RepID=A0ABU2H755_9ACTN|nr:family 1 glycosylhydrolase [Lipingzhangella rawalii]MDS1271135.1 family 1 glycosylhydrolase [Lipingzhangella rawalii]